LYIFGQNDVFEFKDDINTAFSEIISKSKNLKRTTNLKEVYHYCFENNLELNNVVFSCDIASYLIDILEKNHSASVLAERYFNNENILKCFSDLCSKLENLLEEKGFLDLFKNIELPLAKVLANMEVAGFAVDREALDSFGNILSCEITSVQSEIYELAGEEFNIRSVKELGRILFDKLELPAGRKTKNGYSTNAEVLRKLIKYHPIAEKILEYRTLTKLMSTYVIGLIKVIKSDGRVHTLFKQTQTRTGRISSTDPNMQNIPIRTELGSKMRKFFIAKPGYVLIDADYSQIELRILAHLSQDEKMVEAFKNNQDIHNLTASEVFGLDPSNIPSELRRRAKTINFAIIYGIGAFSLSKDINVSVTQAEKYIDAYFEGYSGVCHYMDDIINEADKTGEVKTMFGRVRPVPELKSTKYSTRSLGERIARNTPIQGTAADIIKIAMIKVNDRFLKEGLDAKLILQIHDELLVEASEADSKKAALVLKEEMENAVSMSVPLVADVFIGKTWFDAKN
ncbi:MAG: DNA polymerase I, partial [Oscillospiraceae bacterium]|nr:DNA polymerase I [Oscillospiraceae bacterium]